MSSFLVFGNGWISSQIQELLRASGERYEVSTTRIEDREAVFRDLKSFKPTHVINTAGVRGTPNVDWCEDHREETIRSNIVGATNLVDCCFLQGVHVTHLSSGCIYTYDDEHPAGGKPFTEEDEPNFAASFYSLTKILSEKAIRNYPNVLLLRVRNPFATELHPKNTVTKLFNFKKLINVPNSGTVLTNLLPGAIILAKNKETGIYNFTNPGAFTLSDVMELIKKYLRPSLTWSTFSLEEQAQILKAPRSNNDLDTTKLVKKLEGYGYKVLNWQEALEELFADMRQKGIGVQ